MELAREGKQIGNWKRRANVSFLKLVVGKNSLEWKKYKRDK